MLWNEPNNLSHWDFELDPDWKCFAAMVRLAADAVRSESSGAWRMVRATARFATLAQTINRTNPDVHRSTSSVGSKPRVNARRRGVAEKWWPAAAS